HEIPSSGYCFAERAAGQVQRTRAQRLAASGRPDARRWVVGASPVPATGAPVVSAPFNLSPDGRIAAAARNWALQERKVRIREKPKPGESLEYEAWADTGFYATIQGACRGWAQLTCRRSPDDLPTALQQALQALEHALDELSKATGEL